jgi:hypothetical protein
VCTLLLTFWRNVPGQISPWDSYSIPSLLPRGALPLH